MSASSRQIHGIIIGHQGAHSVPWTPGVLGPQLFKLALGAHWLQIAPRSISEASMSASGPDGPAKKVIDGKVAQAKEVSEKSDFTSGDRLRKMDDTDIFRRPQAQEALTANAADQPGSKEPQPMPEAAKEAMNSTEEFNTSMPKRH